MFKLEAVNKGWLSETDRNLKKAGQRTAGWQKFQQWGSKQRVVSRIAGFFYNFWFATMENFIQKNCGNYRIQNTSSNLNKDMFKFEAVNKGWLSETVRNLKKPGSELLVDRNFNHGEASKGSLAALQASSIIPDSLQWKISFKRIWKK